MTAFFLLHFMGHCQCLEVNPGSAAGAQAGMTSINDFATTYMCQSLPFGGVKESGFDRFAGIEGLRGLCVPKAVAEDRSVYCSQSSSACY